MIDQRHKKPMTGNIGGSREKADFRGFYRHGASGRHHQNSGNHPVETGKKTRHYTAYVPRSAQKDWAPSAIHSTNPNRARAP